MKIKYLLIERAEKAKLLKPEYEVLVYGQYNENMKIFLFANDELEIYDMNESSVEIIDYNLSSYTRLNKLNAGNELYVKNGLLGYLDNFNSTGDINSSHLWNRSKLANYFLNNGYEIPESYKSTVLNERYKTDLIEGFIICFNTLVAQINKRPNRYILYVFSISETKLGFLKDDNEPEYQYVRIPNKDYKTTLIGFLSEGLSKNESKTVEELFKLIDTIFINSISSIFMLYIWGEETISIKYQNKFYAIRKIALY